MHVNVISYSGYSAIPVDPVVPAAFPLFCYCDLFSKTVKSFHAIKLHVNLTGPEVIICEICFCYYH